MTIYFYSTREIYGYFSKFSRHGFKLDSDRWMTSEHYFQAQKFPNTPHVEAIRQAKTPKEVAIMGRDLDRSLCSDWESVKDNIMRPSVICKFEIHTDIRDILLASGDELSAEKTTTDYYWDCGKDGSRKNRLGEILIQVRQILRDRIAGE